ncbi:MAG: glycosyltransferase [Sulfuricella sp.]|nr:glycosyltransferase [Sulfuricella sp.]
MLNAVRAVRNLVRSQGVRGLLKKSLRVLLEEGGGGILRRVQRATRSSHGASYAAWREANKAAWAGHLAALHRSSLDWSVRPRISVVMPVYDAPEQWLRRAIESVLAQSWAHWELCIADDCSPSPHVRTVLEEYRNRDARIKVVYRATNGHISAASNSALALAEGEYVALLDHDDELEPDALLWVAAEINQYPDAALIYSDEDKVDEQGEFSDPYFKPDWNPDLLLSQNYICHLAVYRHSLVQEVGGFREAFEGSQDYDLALRCVERIESRQIRHIPHALYHWRAIPGSTAQAEAGEAKPYAVTAGQRALEEHFQRLGVAAAVSESPEAPGNYRVRYALPEQKPLVSIIIPTRNGVELLRQCVESIRAKTSYAPYEILIVDNGSDDPAALAYFRELEERSAARVLRDDGPFNYPAINNRAVAAASGSVVALLNNDIEVITPDWLEEMVSHALRPEIGAVGARLWYPDDTLQHGGVILVGGVAGHAHKYLPRGSMGYSRRAVLIQDFSAVTAACLVVRKSVYEEIGGLDEVLAVAFNDVDFCLRLQAKGYRNLWTPYAELYHHESATRGFEDTPEKRARFAREVSRMKLMWGRLLVNDPAYNPNLTLDREDFSLAVPPRGPEQSDAMPSATQTRDVVPARPADHRKTAYWLMQGCGIEVGAFNRPFDLPPECRVIYCDVRSRAEALRIFAELKPDALARVDVVTDLDKSGLAAFKSGALDFVVMNDVLPHLANPLRAVEEAFRVVRDGGMVVLAAHDKLFSFDKKRPAPPFEQLLGAYRGSVTTVADENYETFLHVAHPKIFLATTDKIAEALRSARMRREQAYTWDSEAFRKFLDDAMAVLGIKAVCRFESFGRDNRQEYFSVWQKCDQPLTQEVFVAEANRLIEAAMLRLHRYEVDNGRLEAELEHQQALLASLVASTSWRISRPVRLAGKLVRVAKRLASSQGRKMLSENGLRKALLFAVFGTEGQESESVDSGQREAWWQLLPVVRDVQLQRREASADIIVCVHNAPEDVQRCLSSIVRYTLPPYNLIIVDDGSSEPTRDYLREFATGQDALLIRNDQARGYTFAANQGLYAASGDYVILLNSDTIATPDWLDRMAMCAESERSIGMVGPLSNTASWQSVPELEVDGDWACNALPEGVTLDEMATLVACHSARLYPRILFLNGFCLLIKRALIEDVGYFDEETFGRGYGEENDYCLRARKAGWQLAVADDAYIFHAQSKSYSHERRKALCDLAGAALAAKHGHPLIEQGVLACREDRVLQGLRARARLWEERRNLIEQGLGSWEGRRVLFVMPVMAAGGGANVVISEARAMIAMGVDVRILNLRRVRGPFEDSYPELDIPVVYADSEGDFADIASRFDAVVATANHTVQWLESLAGKSGRPVIGYYIQDFEPYFYEENSPEYRIALRSYTAIPEMRCFTKTDWNRDEVLKQTGVRCAVVGPSYEMDTFMPRRRQKDLAPTGRLRICAMVRPSSQRREPLLTMRVLRMIQHAYPQQVEIVIFGVESDDPKFQALPRDFEFVNRGEQTPWQMAALLNEMDVFADFSTYQAMGLTAMEAMSCGIAVILPRAGGADSFAQDEVNALFVDTSAELDCYRALERLVLDGELRAALQRQALHDVARYHPERAAARILQALFGEGGGQ